MDKLIKFASDKTFLQGSGDVFFCHMSKESFLAVCSRYIKVFEKSLRR